MQKKDQPLETKEHDLTDYASLDFTDGNLESLIK